MGSTPDATGAAARLAATARQAGRHETLHETERTRVRRYRLPEGGAVVYKEPLGPDAAERVRHETEVLSRLAGVPHVSRLAGPTDPYALVLEDIPGVPLAGVVREGPLRLPTALAYALDLARTLAQIHGRGVVHQDLNPANVVLREDGRPILVDFAIASTFAEESRTFTHHREMVGTLPYLAPEQTGRAASTVDHRADLYALGATLYEMIIGTPPFGDGDALQLVRDALLRVPAPLSELDPRVPRATSDLVARLLSKEPDRRYQSAAGLAHDLAALRSGFAPGFRLGERDYPSRLAAPSRPVGREQEIDALRRAFADAIGSSRRGVLVTGGPGVGKSTLLAELRSIVTAEGGWFVAGKLDQYRRDGATGAAVQVLRGLGRLLLAEPEAEQAAQCERIVQALGSNAGLVTAVVPEFSVLLGMRDLPPGAREAGGTDPLVTASRLGRAELDLLRVVATPQRPLVVVLDDLQWAGPATLEFVDRVLTDDQLRALLLVGAYRPGEVDGSHPLPAMLSRWRRLGVAPATLGLENLAAADLREMLGHMLRLAPARAAGLTRAVAGRTAGNPYDTVELAHALRRDGLLRLGGEGWEWDEEGIRRCAGRGSAVDPVRERVAGLPKAAVELLRTMSCLGNEVSVGTLAVASDLPVAAVWHDLTPALQDGLLILARGGQHGGVRGDAVPSFRHDRVRQAVHDGLDPDGADRLRLSIARRLAAADGHEMAAAEQYLPVVSALTGAGEALGVPGAGEALGVPGAGEALGVLGSGERRRVAALFRLAATRTAQAGNHAAALRYLSAEASLRADGETPPGDPAPIDLDIARHALLYAQGRLDEADEAYESLYRRGADPLLLAGAAAIQVTSLTNRARCEEALGLGFEALEALGLATPRGDLAAQVERRAAALSEWIGRASVEGDLARPEVEDPRVPAVARLLHRMGPPAYICSPSAYSWLIQEGQRLWEEYGPCAPLVSTIATAALSPLGGPDGYQTRARIVRHVLAVGEARSVPAARPEPVGQAYQPAGQAYQPATADARLLHVLGCSAWTEPIEDGVCQARAVRDALLHHGDAHMAAFTYIASGFSLFDCAPTLDVYGAEVDAGLTFSRRIGQITTTDQLLVYRQAMRALRGQTRSATSLADSDFDEADFLARGAQTNPVAVAVFHAYRALVAAIFGDMTALARETDAFMPLLFLLQGNGAAQARLLRALSLAHQVRTASVDPPERTGALAELDELCTWWARRSVDAPANFQHLRHLIDAERAWAVRDFPTAGAGFDLAAEAADRRERPWHRALIAERAGAFHLIHGLTRTSRHLLAEARSRYSAWGATAKVRAMDRDYPFLCRGARTAPQSTTRSTVDARRAGGAPADPVDLLAVLHASQAISGETDLGRLRTAVADQLSTLTGATTVLLALFNEDAQSWYVPAADSSGPAVPLEEAGTRGQLPLTAFRYAQRTRDPVLVHDAVRDDRFARDPYLTGLRHCSLLLVPIVSRGTLRAVLYLENRHTAGAFTGGRLDAVTLLAGHLAICIDNAVLYRSLEERVAERTRELAIANRQLEILNNTDGLTLLANRRRFNETLDREWARAIRNQTPLSLVLADIDDFQRYNDRYGHLAGDECIRRVARLMQEKARRATDLVCRYGGEEYVLILPETGAEGARTVAENIRTCVAGLALPHPSSENGIVTISLGYATAVPRRASAPDALLHTADLALYQAKSAGRNAVCAAPEDPVPAPATTPVPAPEPEPAGGTVAEAAVPPPER